MKKLLSLVLALALVLTLAACGPVATIPADVEIPNPWQDFDTLTDAEAAIGYGMTAPETLARLAPSSFRVLDSNGAKILEVCYGGGENTERASLRKAPEVTSFRRCSVDTAYPREL